MINTTLSVILFIVRSIVLHATLRLIPLLKQLRKGLQVYNFVDILEEHLGLCQHFFVPSEADDDNEVSLSKNILLIDDV